MKKKIFGLLLSAFFCLTGAFADDPAIPTAIQNGNILHCFNWPLAQVKAELPNIAKAGFGSVQVSPLQRPDVRTGENWHALYRPYDIAFKASSGMGSADDLKALCTEAAKYGIKVIVDVVANHVDKTSGYHDTWWDASGRVRWNGSINYGDRYSITHGQLGDYGDVNSEDAQVIARAKAYVQDLANMGVKGIRWDAAKHIGLPSEGCNFWKEVTSVAGVWHYGEILDSPGPNASIIKEYANYMAVTDNRYCNYAARDNGGIPTGYGGDWVVNYGLGNKCVYWAESHDTYANDEWSQNRSQEVIDRAYAAYACRNNEAALYLSGPNTSGFNNIKVVKGSTHYTVKSVAEVNKFRNAMVGKKDYFTHSNGNVSVTRENGGAVVVMKGSGNVSIANGGGYCPTGDYVDRVAGGKFTVTASTISGTVGSTGIAVLWKDENGGNGGGGDDPIPPTPPTPEGDMWILGNLGAAGWGTTPGTGVAMTKSGNTYTAKNVTFTALAGETKCYFNLTDYVGSTWDDLNMGANRYGAATEGEAIKVNMASKVVKYANNVDASGCLSWTVAPGKYDVTFDSSAMTILLTGESGGDDPTPPTPGTLTIEGDYNLAYSGTKTKVYYWGTSTPTWPGVAMATAKGSDGNTYKVYKVPAGTTGIIFNSNGDSDKTGDLTYTGEYVMDDNGATTTKVTFKNGGGDDPTPPTPPVGEGITIYYDNSATNWGSVNIHYWTTPQTTWPGVNMTKVEGSIWKYTFNEDTSALAGFLFNDGSGSGDSNQTADYTKAPQANHLYKGAGGSKGAVSDMGVYGNANPDTPVVTASPASGTTFKESIDVTLSVSPAATIYYTINGSAPSTSSTRYTAAITLTETTTLKTLAVTSSGAQNTQSFTYTKKQGGDDPVVPGNNLITDYYKVNPDGKVGSNRTVAMSFNGQKSTTAMGNWTEADLIAQGVARDVAQAMKGNHERPIVDSYAIYAAYDNDNLYLGVQFVYTVWDLYGEGKQPGESKPYNMDGHMVWAFDLDPDSSFDGYIDGKGPIWNETQQGAKFQNGVDAVWCGSTKPGVGTPGFFIPTPDGHASYSAAYCKSISGSYYGYADGLLPSITQIWGQKDFNFDPEVLTGNTGFVDLSGEVDKTAHTFYEWKFPLSTLGVTAEYIKNHGIGVMYLDKYGSSPVGGTPYDPSYFDNVKDSYSMDPSSSKEKEDEDIITYAPARIGKLLAGVDEIITDGAVSEEDATPVYYNLQGVRIANPQGGPYIVVRGNKVSKEIVR